MDIQFEYGTPGTPAACHKSSQIPLRLRMTFAGMICLSLHKGQRQGSVRSGLMGIVAQGRRRAGLGRSISISSKRVSSSMYMKVSHAKLWRSERVRRGSGQRRTSRARAMRRGGSGARAACAGPNTAGSARPRCTRTPAARAARPPARARPRLRQAPWAAAP